jgi:hypothetical protein
MLPNETRKDRKILISVLCAGLFFGVLSCRAFVNSVNQDDQQTQVALETRQADVANKETKVAAVSLTPNTTSTITPSNTNTPTITTGPSETPTPEIIPSTGFSEDDFQEWMTQANILLFEDMVINPSYQRFVKTTLNEMRISDGITFVDVGNATGKLRERLIVGTEEGEDWDLVILAIESRSQVSGELFEYLKGVMDNGSSVILEEWMLDKIFRGKVKPILDECGVGVGNYIGGTGIRLDYFLDPVIPSHPVLNEPNADLNFKNIVFFWEKELGDLVYLTGSGDAEILLKLARTEELPNGVLAVCLDNRLILQTFSSHNFPEDMMVKVWENYIYNALKARYMYLRD